MSVFFIFRGKNGLCIRHGLVVTILFFISLRAMAGNETLSSGAFIINMGVTPQTYANGLKPYGMLYDLIYNYNVTVKWVINTTKAKDGADFTYSAVDYKGGTFIIQAQEISSAVATRITYWTGQGVQGVYTTASITVPVYATLSYFPKAMIDNTSGKESVIIAYYTNAALPASSYVTGNPSQLTSCQDIWANPHGDPTWATHSYLYNYVTVQKSFIWSQCHAVSVLEGVANSSSPFQVLNYLTTAGLKCYSANKCGANTETHSSGATTPYTHNYASDPVMQFMGTMDGGTTTGSEQWYIPQSTSAWRSTTLRLVTTSDGTSPNEGVKMAYGPAYGDGTNGYVMYEGGHDLDGSGTTAEKVAAQRTFFNFLLLSGLNKQMLLTSSSMPTAMACTTSTPVSVNVSGGNTPYTYAWSATTGGSFASTTVSSTTYTAPSNLANGIIKCIITDACGRTRVVTSNLSVSCALPVTNLSFAVKEKNNSAVLDWSTATEINNDHFTVWKGKTSKDFKELIQVKGVGTSTATHFYSFTDTMPFEGDNYYLLTQADNNGAVDTFPVRYLRFNGEYNTFSIDGAGPIPFDDELRINYEVNQATAVDFILSGFRGDKVRRQQVYSEKGKNSFAFNDLASLEKGIYFLTIRNKEGDTRNLKLMKQ
jgi:hypothetical protein